MNTNQFQYLAALSLHDGQMTTGDLLQYIGTGELIDEDIPPVKQDLAELVASGLVEAEPTDSGWRTVKLTITEIGFKIADFWATLKMEQMIQECYHFFAPNLQPALAAAT